MCHVWTSLAPADLCARNSWARLRRMRSIGGGGLGGFCILFEYLNAKSNYPILEGSKSSHFRNYTFIFNSLQGNVFVHQMPRWLYQSAADRTVSTRLAPHSIRGGPSRPLRSFARRSVGPRLSDRPDQLRRLFALFRASPTGD